DKRDLDLLLDTLNDQWAARQVAVFSHLADLAGVKFGLRESRAIEPIPPPDCLFHFGVDHVSARQDNGNVGPAFRKPRFVEMRPHFEFLENSRRTSLLKRSRVLEFASRKVQAPLRRVCNANGADQQQARQQLAEDGPTRSEW